MASANNKGQGEPVNLTPGQEAGWSPVVPDSSGAKHLSEPDPLKKEISVGTMATQEKTDLIDHPSTKRQKLRRHCVKFWVWYLIGFIIFLAIFLPLFFLKIIPAIAQAIVNDTGLPVYGGTLRAVSNDKVAIGLNTALNIPNGLTVKLDPLEMWLYNEETPDYSPYLMVPLPSQTINGHTDLIIEETVLDIRNRTELGKWLAKILEREKTDISVKGTTKAHLGALNFDISLNKKIQVDALQKLSGFRMDNARIKLPPDEDGSNLLGNLTLPNTSDLTLAFGNLSFNVWAGEILVGSATVFNVEAKPGNNTMPFRGEVFMNALFQNFVEILSSQAQAFGSGMLEVSVSGNKTIVNGEHITYVEETLNAVRVKSQIPIIQLLSDVLRSILNGDVELKGLADIIKDGLGPLLDDLLKGLLGEEGGSSPLKGLLGGGSESGRRNVIRKVLKAYKGGSNMSLERLRAHTLVIRSLARVRSRSRSRN